MIGASLGGKTARPQSSGRRFVGVFVVSHFLWLSAGIVLPATSFGAQAERPVSASEDQDVSLAFVDMKNDQWLTREKGFRALFRHGAPSGLQGRMSSIDTALANLLRRFPARAEEMRTSLIDLLRTETVFMKSATLLGEDFGYYHGDLIAAVAALKDKRAVEVLADNIATGNMATRGLAAIGRDALGVLLPLASGADPTGKRQAVRTMAQMMEPANRAAVADRSTMARIKAALFVAARDSDGFVRLNAIAGLSQLPDQDVTELLTAISVSDPFVRTAEGRSVYLVRDAAKKALQSRPAR